MASTALLVPAVLGFRVRRRGQPSFSLRICRVAVLEGSSRQPTLYSNLTYAVLTGLKVANNLVNPLEMLRAGIKGLARTNRNI
jgi:hypothetical protein